MAKEDIVLTLGVDISSVKTDMFRAANEAAKILKDQKLVANIAFQLGITQGELRKQLKKVGTDAEKYWQDSLKNGTVGQLLTDKLIADQDDKTTKAAENARRLAASTANASASVTRSTSKMRQGFDEISSPSLRYALYDVSSTLLGIAAAAGGAAAGTVALATKYETAFTSIERTTVANARSLELLNYQFLQLARTIPVSYKELTKIGSIGAQLGIGQADIAGFTKTVAEFAAVTDVGTEGAAQAFGAIGELIGVTANEYANLGSSIAYVGINSKATETEIIAVATAISAVANQAGFTEDYIIGLSGALASLKVPAEQSRGALTRTIQEINRAAVEGGPAFQNFADVLGVSYDEAQRLASTDIETFFNKFLVGLSGMNSQDLTRTLDSLSLSDIRVTNTLTRLAGNLGVVNKSLADSSYGFKNSSILSQLFGRRTEDLAAKFTILLSSLSELGAQLGETFLPVIGFVVDGLTQMANTLSDAFESEAGQALAVITTALVVVTATLAGLTGAAALATASMAAFNFVIKDAGIKGATLGLKGFISGLLGVQGAAIGAAAAGRTLRIVLASLGVGLAIAGISALVEAMSSAANNADIQWKNYISNTSGLASAMAADVKEYSSAIASGNQELISSFEIVNIGIASNTKANEENSNAISRTAGVLGIMPVAIDDITKEMGTNTAIIGDNTRAWIKNQLVQNDAFQELAGNADFFNYFNALGADFDEVINIAAKEGQQGVIDYFRKLETTGQGAAAIAGGTISSAFLKSIRGGFSGEGATLDPFSGVSNAVGKIGTLLAGQTGAYQLVGSVGSDAGENITESFEEAADSIGGAAAKVRTLLDYANDLETVFSRAFDIRFSGASTLDQITSSFLKIADATEQARQEIETLNADIDKLSADRKLKEYFLQVAEAYGDTIRASQLRAEIAKIDADLVKKSKDLAKQQDKTNKTLVGSSEAAIENRSEIRDLVKSYQDHVKALAASGMEQDQLALATEQLRQDFITQATQLGYNESELQMYAAAFGDVSVAIGNVPRDITVEANADPALQALNEFVAQANSALGGVNRTVKIGADTSAAQDSLSRFGRNLAGFIDLNYRYSRITNSLNSIGVLSAAGRAAAQAEAISIKNALNNGTWATGGYTGAGGKYEVAGIVHRGEYVVPKEQVNQSTGTPYFMQQTRSFATGGYAGGQATSMMVELSPTDRALLRSAGGSGEVILYANNEAIARSSNAGNRQIVATGGRP